MKRWTRRHQPRLITEISVTPLLDLVFVLLLVFMVAAPLMNRDQSLAVPISESAEAAVLPGDIVKLTVNREQALALDGRSVSLGELGESVGRIVSERPNVGVVVEIHRELPIQLLVDVMDRLSGAGVKKTSVVATEPPRE